MNVLELNLNIFIEHHLEAIENKVLSNEWS